MTRDSITLAMLSTDDTEQYPRIAQFLNPRVDHVAIVCDPKHSSAVNIAAQAVFPEFMVREREWPNDFADARNDLIEYARKYDDDYVLMLDADDPFVGTIQDQLGESYYGFLNVDQTTKVSWWRQMMFHRDCPVTYIGPIHEYPEVAQMRGIGLATGIIEVRKSSGGTDRWRNFDIPILLKWNKREPKNPRVTYYLAETYKNIQEYDLALYWFKKRSRMLGFNQETFQAMYMIACIYEMQDKTRLAMEWFHRAFAYRPSRREPLQHLVDCYTKMGNYLPAIELQKNLATMPASSDVLLVENRPLPQVG